MLWYRRPVVALAFDVLLAGFVCLPLELAAVARAPRGQTAVAIVLIAVQGALLVARRHLPTATFAGVLACAVGIRLAGYAVPPFPLYVALATLAAYRSRRDAAVGAALVAMVTLVWLDRTGFLPERWSYELLLTAAAWAVGDAFRSRRNELEALRDRAARAEGERAEGARRAVAEEQARIARELHDVIAHNVSVVVVQAAAALDVFDAQPERARSALGSIEATGREAMAELRRLLGAVRDGDDAFRPQPGLGRMDELVEQVRGAGLAVAVTIDGAPRALPPGVDLSAYRIVQEALTNTLRHAHASRADVALRFEPDAIVVDVRDDGAGGHAATGAGGHGLVGMRERAALLGGSLEVGPAAPRGFQVRARLPLPPTGAAAA